MKVEEIEIIDTSSTPKEEKAPEAKAEEKVDSQGLTEEDKAAIESIMDERLIAELQSIYSKIIEKAEFLIKLQVPMAYLVKDPSIKKQGTLLLLKDPSSQEGPDGQPATEVNWKDRLKSWR